MSESLLPVCSRLGMGLLSLLIAIGTAWAFQRGANDFSVFYEAWRLVLHGHGSQIYHATPDRFLYAPGFAWILSPLGLFPRWAALALWCFGKAAVIGLMIRTIGLRLRWAGILGWGVACWGAILVARPLLIDFQYGQVNTFVLFCCVWALSSHLKRDMPGKWDFLAWFALGIAACTKLLPLPLLLVPWLARSGVERPRLRLERIGAVLGVVLVLAFPALTEGVSGAITLTNQWRDALIGRGFPTETHNQSFAAFLYHYLSGKPSGVIAQAAPRVFSFGLTFSSKVLLLVSAFWSLAACVLMLLWFWIGPRKKQLVWLAVAIAFLILPSHLVWKPYFVFSFPLGAVALAQAIDQTGEFQRWLRFGVLAVLFLMINFTGFNFVGANWAARFEAASLFLLVHLVLMLLVILDCRKSVTHEQLSNEQLCHDAQ